MKYEVKLLNGTIFISDNPMLDMTNVYSVQSIKEDAIAAKIVTEVALEKKIDIHELDRMLREIVGFGYSNITAIKTLRMIIGPSNIGLMNAKDYVDLIRTQ